MGEIGSTTVDTIFTVIGNQLTERRTFITCIVSERMIKTWTCLLGGCGTIVHCPLLFYFTVLPSTQAIFKCAVYC